MVGFLPLKFHHAQDWLQALQPLELKRTVFVLRSDLALQAVEYGTDLRRILVIALCRKGCRG